MFHRLTQHVKESRVYGKASAKRIPLFTRIFKLFYHNPGEKYLGGDSILVKEYLSQSFVLARQIKAKQEQIAHIKDLQTSIGAGLNPMKVQTSGRRDKLGDLSAAALDLESDYVRQVTELLILKYNINQLIEKAQEPVHRLVLEERYLNLKTWEQIAADNNYCFQWLHKIHAKALKAIENDYLSML